MVFYCYYTSGAGAWVSWDGCSWNYVDWFRVTTGATVLDIYTYGVSATGSGRVSAIWAAWFFLPSTHPSPNIYGEGSATMTIMSIAYASWL